MNFLHLFNLASFIQFGSDRQIFLNMTNLFWQSILVLCHRPSFMKRFKNLEEC